MSVKVAVIGTGWPNRVQIPAFQAAGIEVIGVSGRHATKAARVARKHGIPFSTDRWQELLELPCDLISICSPPYLHREQVTSVLAAGKHLLCEKPLALSGQEAATMVAAAASHPGQLALVDHELRFCPARRKARELIESGALGRVLLVTARVALNARIDPTLPWSWWSAAELGGGILGAIGSHVLDGIRWLLGSVGEITIRGATLGRVYPQRRDAEGHEREVTSDDIASLTFALGEAVGTMLVHGAALDDSIDMLTIRGSEGTLVLDRSLKLYLGKRDGILKEYVTNLPPTVPNRFRASAYAAGTVLLGEALRQTLAEGDASALAEAATLEDGAAVQELLDAARAAAG